jgi:hypothetical protein
VAGFGATESVTISFDILNIPASAGMYRNPAWASGLTSFMNGSAGSRADDKAPALPGDILLDGERRVAEFLAELLGWLFFALANLSAIDHDVVFVCQAIDANGTE